MPDRHLGAGGSQQCGPGAHHLRGPFAAQVHAQRGGRRVNVVLTAESDVGVHSAVLGDLDGCVQPLRPGRHVAHLDVEDLRSLDPSRRLHESNGRVDPNDGPRFRHRQRAGLENGRHRTHRVGARHGSEAALLQDDDRHIGLFCHRRHDQYATHRGMASRLTEKEHAQVVEVLLARSEAFAHSGAAHLEVSAQQHAADLALGMNVHTRHHELALHDQSVPFA
jgi:hypothetical protein